MRSVAATIYQWLAWFILAGLVVQVFFAGLGAFGATSWNLHETWGHFFEVFYLLLLLASLIGTMGKRLILMSLLLFVLMMVQGFLPDLKEDLPVVAAYHPVNALVLLFVTHRVAMGARAFREQTGAPRDVVPVPSAPGPPGF